MKNKVLLFLCIALCSITVAGYSQATPDSLTGVLDPEKKAEFKGGMNGWVKFLEKNLDRELLVKKKAPKGTYRVTGNFLVDHLGGVTDIHIKNDPGYGAVDEFIRVIKLSSGKWVPANDKGAAVAFRLTQSITLMIGEQ